MLQFVYISTLSRSVDQDPTDDILSVSRRNNRRDAVSGVLLHRGRRFLQVLEGDHDVVLATIARIRRDPRHRAIVSLSERRITASEFGAWSMASDRDLLVDRVIALVDGLTRDASPNVRALFTSYAAMDIAA